MPSPDPASTEADDGARTRVAVLAAVVTGLLTTSVVLWGSVGTDIRLVRDHVTVPDPARPVGGLFPTGAAELRAWPLDGVTWLLTRAFPAGSTQSALVVLSVLAGGVGVGVLLRRRGVTAVAAAVVVGVWNPYVAERLLLGQPAVLLGAAALPWVLLAARARTRLRRRLVLLTLAMAPAAVTPWGGVVALGAAVLGTASRGDRTWRDVTVVGGLGLLGCAPWLVPALVGGGVDADADGAAAFALADDTGAGALVSALLGGGIWAPGAVPQSRTEVLALGCSLALLLAALAGAVVGLRGRRRIAALAALLLPAAVLALASGPALPVTTALQSIPGVALVRDQHRLLAPTVLVGALLVGLLVEVVGRSAGRPAAAVVAVLAVGLAVGSVPDLPRTLRTAYRPVDFPADWRSATAAATPPRGAVLSLPWQPLRRPAWRGAGPAFLDPTPRAVHVEVLTSGVLTVRREDRVLVVDDTPVLDASDWARGVVTGESLRRHGIVRVVEWLGTPGTLPASRRGWVLLHDGPDLRVWDVTAAS